LREEGIDMTVAWAEMVKAAETGNPAPINYLKERYNGAMAQLLF